MNQSEAVTLCRYVKAVCPQQAIDEFTPTAWADLLGDLRFEDCRDAVRAIAGRQPFCAPAEIRTDVKRIRAERCAKADAPIPPADLDPVAAARWVRAAWRAIGDGQPVPDNGRQLGIRALPAGLKLGHRVADEADGDGTYQRGVAAVRAILDQPKADA